MSCAEFEDDLWMLIEDGTFERRSELAAHAASCVRCASSEREYRAMVRLGKLAFRDHLDPRGEETQQLVASILSARLAEISPGGSRPS